MALSRGICLGIRNHAGKHRVLAGQQILRRIHLIDATLVEHYHTVVVHNCVLKKVALLPGHKQRIIPVYEQW